MMTIEQFCDRHANGQANGTELAAALAAAREARANWLRENTKPNFE
jgi:hypothetical protein